MQYFSTFTSENNLYNAGDVPLFELNHLYGIMLLLRGADMSELLAIKIQLVSDGTAVHIDIEPPLNDEQKDLIRNAPVLHDIPDDTLAFNDHLPDSGNPFTEINCATIRTGAEYRGLKLDEANFAQEIADILEKHGEVIKLDTVIKPIEQSGYMFLGLSTNRP
jgi:hypothetical protein